MILNLEILNLLKQHFERNNITFSDEVPNIFGFNFENAVLYAEHLMLPRYKSVIQISVPYKKRVRVCIFSNKEYDENLVRNLQREIENALLDINDRYIS